MQRAQNTHMTISIDGSKIRVAGEVDIAGRADLAEAVLQPSADDPIIFDLVGVTFIDSAGLAALLDATRRPAGAILIAVSDPVRRLIALSGTADLFDDGSENGCSGAKPLAVERPST